MKPIAALAALLAVTGAGCAGASFSPDFGDASATDGGATRTDSGMDAAFGEDAADGTTPAPPSDGGTMAPPPGIPADPSRSAPVTGEGLASGGAGPVAACFDGADNDDASGTDCGDPACASLASCCVGRGDCCAAAPANPLPALLDFSTCPGTAFDACADTLGAELVAFGSPSPFLDDGALAAGGDIDFDSGATIGAPVDLLAHRLVLTTTFADAEGCDAGCLESVAVGVTGQASLDDTSHVRAAAALLFSASRGTVALVIGDEVVGTYAHGDADDVWELTLRPSGTVTVRQDGAQLAVTAWSPIANAQVLVYGRSRNPMATVEAGARIGSLGAELSLCDMPRAWRARTPLVLEEAGAAVVLDRAQGASVAAGPSETLLLIGDGGRLLAATEDMTRPGTFVLTAPVDNPALAPAFDYDALAVSDPALSWNEGVGLYEAFFTATAMDGTRSVGRATQEAGAMSFVAEGAAVLSPSDFGFAHLDHPTALRHSGRQLLVARATLADGRQQLVAFVDEGAGFTRFTTTDLETVTDTGNDDADALGGLSLMIHDHAYHLHYARRRGTRWQVGLLASDAFVSWRRVDDAVLGASGAGFDRIGASAPSARSLGDAVELVFVGHDGVRNTLARTRRLATSNGAPL